MTRILLAAAGVLLLTGPVFAEGADFSSNNPNELPQFMQRKPPAPAEWAGPFFHSRVTPFPRQRELSERTAPPGKSAD